MDIDVYNMRIARIGVLVYSYVDKYTSNIFILSTSLLHMKLFHMKQFLMYYKTPTLQSVSVVVKSS